MTDKVRIGAWAAFWGDTSYALEQILDGAEIDYLVSDYLSEITMALLARARAKDPAAGFVADAVDALTPRLADIHARGIKVITNAGALNPVACADALRAAADAAGIPLRIAAVAGDDLSDAADAVLLEQARDMFTGDPLPARPMTMNAYLGARPIADALAAGADVVVTGRCADSAVVLGPLMHEFGWSDGDHDLLSAGTLAGHIIECGPQCTGGNFTDWHIVPGWDDLGFPIAECHADGTAVITKPAGSGGLVSPGTVAEQILYEIGDPGAYLMPDVVCDWREVRLAQDGENRVSVSGARGSAPTTTYKVTATHAAGYRSMTTALFTGFDAGAKARRVGEALIARTQRLIAAAGHEPLAEASIEVIGAGDVYGPGRHHDDTSEAVVKVGVRHPDRAALEIFAREFAPMALVAQGMTGFFAGRPRVAPAIEVYHLLVDKQSVPVRIVIDGDEHPVAVAAGSPDACVQTPQLGEVASDVTGETVTVPLRRLAYGRSGDKGNDANIGVIARRPQFASVIHEQVTVARVADAFGHYLNGGVQRWELPGLAAVNFLLRGVLGGRGGTSTLRYDPQGKSYAAMLLELPVTVPASWEREGLLAPGPTG